MENIEFSEALIERIILLEQEDWDAYKPVQAELILQILRENVQFH